MKTVESVSYLPTLAVQAAGLLRARSAAGRRPELAPETSVKNTIFLCVYVWNMAQRCSTCTENNRCMISYPKVMKDKIPKMAQ